MRSAGANGSVHDTRSNGSSPSCKTTRPLDGARCAPLLSLVRHASSADALISERRGCAMEVVSGLREGFDEFEVRIGSFEGASPCVLKLALEPMEVDGESHR